MATIDLDVRKEIPEQCWAGASGYIPRLFAKLWPTEDGFFAFHYLGAGSATTSYGVLGFYRANGQAVARRVGTCPKNKPCCDRGVLQPGPDGAIEPLDAMLEHYAGGSASWSAAASVPGNRLLHCIPTYVAPYPIKCELLSAKLGKVGAFELPVPAGHTAFAVLRDDQLAVALQTSGNRRSFDLVMARYTLAGQKLGEVHVAPMASIGAGAVKSAYEWNLGLTSLPSFPELVFRSDGNSAVLGELSLAASVPGAFPIQHAGVGRINVVSGDTSPTYLPRAPQHVGQDAATGWAVGVHIVQASTPGELPWLQASGTMARIQGGLHVRGAFVTIAPGLVNMPLRAYEGGSEGAFGSFRTELADPWPASVPTGNIMLLPIVQLVQVPQGSSPRDRTGVAVFCVTSTSAPLAI
ncbi:MAG: hypothetical protein FJ100_22045 [Deltaproteobacteria bacterium]|nr:hypothetical protein [Deltaproteobacteria bacterium]